MSQDEEDSISNQSDSEPESKPKSQSLVPYSKKNIFLYDRKCRTVLHLGVLYKNLSKAAANSINLDKITKKIQSMINKNKIYLRDVGPIILGITKIIVKKTFFLYKDIEELTNLRINNSKKEIQDNSDIKTKEKKNKNFLETSNKKRLLSDDIVKDEGEGTLAMNINSMETDGLNIQNSMAGFDGSAFRNKKGGNNKYNDLTFSKDIIELTNDDMIRRTIQKIKKFGDSDIKEIIDNTNKKNNKSSDIKFDTENKNSKTLKNLRDILLNKNSNLNSVNINDINGDDNSVNVDENNKDVDNFFTVIKSQIENNQNDNNDDNELNFDFNINMNDFKDEYNLYSNKKYKINQEEFKNNLKSKNNVKSTFMLRNAKLKYDNELEMDIDSIEENKKKSKNEEIDKELQEENRYKLKNIQTNNTFYLFDKNMLTSFTNEKYEYLLPQFLEAKDDEEIDDNQLKMDSYLRKEDTTINSNIKSKSSEKNDISRAERFTSSNKKKLSLANFDSNNALMNNLSKLTLDKNDFKGAKSFIEKIADIEKENKDTTDNDIKREEINSNFNEDINNDFIDQDNDMNILNGNKDKISEDLKEEEDAILLKNDLENNVFSKSKKKISFDKIREKLENKDKFEEPKLFYDLLLLAQKGDIDITQQDLMKNKSINISLNY